MKGEPVASVVQIVPRNKADDGAGDRVESAGNETAPDPQDDDAQSLTVVAGTTKDAEPNRSRATTSAEGTSGFVNAVAAATERAGDANDTSNYADADGEEESVATKGQTKKI